MKKNKPLIAHVKHAILMCCINAMAHAQCSLTSGPNATVINYECPQDILYITATIPYNGIYAQGRAFTKFGAGNGGHYKKPLIMVEGLDLDIGNNHDQGHRIGDRGWPNFIAGISNEREPNDHILDNLPILLNDLNSKGYDLIYFDHVDGATYMQANAMALVKLIQDINTLKVGNEPITIVGASMGGQIVKYALSYMEKNNIKHCINEYLSFDSPHQGANMPVSLQKFVSHYAPLKSEIATMRDKLNLPAAQQLLSLHAAGDYTGPSNLRTTWLTDLAALGTYPTKTRKVAIANGSSNATEIFAKGAPMMGINLTSPSLCNSNSLLHATLNGCGLVNTYDGKRPNGATYPELLSNYFACDINCLQCVMTPSVFFDEKTLDTPTSKNYDGCAGSYRDTQDAFYKVIEKALQSFAGDLGLSLSSYVASVHQPNHSFVSTVSALDINTSNLAYHVSANIPNNLVPNIALHPFDAFYAPPSNEFHVAFNADNIQWIIEEMGSIESKLSYVNYILTTNTALAPVYNSGIYNFSRPESSRLLRSMSIIDGGKLYVNKNEISDFAISTPGYSPHNTGGIGSSPYIFPISGSTYTLETCDCVNTEVKVDHNGEFVIGDTNTPINNKAVVLFHDGSTLRIKAGGTLTIRSGSKLIMEQNATFIVEQGGQVLIEQGGELILQKNAVATSAGQITLNPSAKLTQEPLSSLTLNSNSKLIVNDHAKVLVSTTYTNNVANDNAVLTFNQGAQLQLKGDDAVLELNGRLHIGDYANFSFTYPGSNSGYINFNRGAGTWWDNWATGNAHITCGNNASFKLVGQSKTDKVMVINQNVVAMPKNITQFSINTGLVEFNTFDASLESDNIVILNNSTLKGIVSSPHNHSGRGVTMFGQWLFIAGNCDFLNLRTGITAALFYGNNKLSNVTGCLFKECKIGIQTFGAGTDLTNNTFLNNEEAIFSQGLEYNSFVKKNTITAPALAGYSNPTTILGGPMGVIVTGNNGVYDFNNNTVNNTNTALFTLNNTVKLRCNDFTNNEFVLNADINSKINMSTLLGGGYNDASNSIKFARFNEANLFEANQGYNSFKILDQSHCYTAISPAPGHPSYVSCPIIADGSINNYTSYNTITHKYELLAELNFWRSLYFPGNMIEHEYFNITKAPLSGPIYNGELITGTPLTSVTQAVCPIDIVNNGGGGLAQRVHPLDNKSGSSIISTPSFNNERLQYVVTFSMGKMDDMNNLDKLNQAADLLTEILNFNYPSLVSNQNDAYLLELAYQKLVACVAQLTELYSDSLGVTSIPPSRYDDLHSINKLRLSWKDEFAIDYKESKDLIKLDDALIYGLAKQRTNAISKINEIIAGSPKKEHLKLFEHWRCIYSTEEDAINHVISTEEAITNLLKCNNDILSMISLSANAKMSNNTNKPNEVSYAKDNAIAVYPNPTKGSITIAYDLKDYNSIEFVIFDIHGKRMGSYELNAEEHQFNIDNLNLENGVYVYSIKADGENLMTKKIVVMN